MQKFKIMILLSFAALFAENRTLGANSPSERDEPPDLRCGGYCLYVGLKALGVKIADYTELETTLGQPGPHGYTMQQLADAAEAFGLHSLGVQTTAKELQRLKARFVCVALLDKNHYVNIYDIDKRYVYVIDPPQSRVVPIDGFNAIWDGRALLIAAEPIKLPGFHYGKAALPSLLSCVAVIIIGYFLFRRSSNE